MQEKKRRQDIDTNIQLEIIAASSSKDNSEIIE